MRLPVVALAVMILFTVPPSAAAGEEETLTAAVEGATPGGSVPTTTGEATPEAEGTTTQPAATETETEEVASPAPSTGSPAKVVSDVQAPVERAPKRLSTLTNSTPTPPASGEPRPRISLPDTGTEAAAAAVTAPAPARRVAGLIERTRKRTIDKTVARATDPVAGVVDRVSASLADTGLLPRAADLLGPLVSATTGVVPTTPTMHPGGSAGDRGVAFSRLPGTGGPLSNLGTIGLRSFANAGPVLTDGLAALGIQALKSGHGITVPSSETGGRLTGHTASAVSHRSGGSSSPGLPFPAPGSPTTGVAGSGAPTFFPIVALLALLALVAPAATRRLGEAPDFRAPIQFVCALERPG